MCKLRFMGTLGLRFRTRFGDQTPAKSVHTVRMEGSSKTVPSIVVYVTVPNKELGSCFPILSQVFAFKGWG